MNKLKIEDPQNFQFASVVVKQSKSGFSSNRRLLVIRGGHLYYFSTVPASFSGDTKILSYIHELPKHSIEILSIKRVKPNEMSSCVFEIVFDQCHLMEREDIRKTLLEGAQFAPRKKGEEVVWRFTCDNNLLKQKWVSCLAQMRDYLLKEKEKVEKYFWELEHKHDKDSLNSSQSATSKAPWRESTALRKQYSINDLKSLGDIPATEFDNLDPLQKGNQQFRLTSSYNPKADLSGFEQDLKELTMTDPGVKEVKMKKMGVLEIGTKKAY